MAQKIFTVEGYTGSNPDFEVELRLRTRHGKVDGYALMSELDRAFRNGVGYRESAIADYLDAYVEAQEIEQRDDLAESGEQVWLIYGLPNDSSHELDEMGETYMLRICAA